MGRIRWCHTGDSRICVAAVHAGYISLQEAVANRTVDVRTRRSLLEVRELGLISLSRNTWFPVGFEFSSAENCWGCQGFPFQLVLLFLMFVALAAQPRPRSLEILLSTSIILGAFYLQLVDMKPRGNPRLQVSDALTRSVNVFLVGNIMLWWSRRGTESSSIL